jgi:hypothetical protein
MATIPGSVRVGGFIAPTDDTDTFAVTDDTYGRGGYRAVADTTARNAITADRRKIGMLVRTNGTGLFYTLSGGITNGDWVQVVFGAEINDSLGSGATTVTWSADKITAAIAQAKSDLVNGAGATLDTLNELAAALNNDANYSATVATALGNRVRYDAAQSLTGPQQLQACTNIGVGDPDINLVTTYTTAKT